METLIRYGIGNRAFYQVLALDMEGMQEEAKWTRSLNPDAIIKIPSTQAMLAIQAGAPYVAPYVNRISDSDQDGVDVVLSILNFIDNQNLQCEIIAASFKNLNQITRLLEAGVHSVTVPYDLCMKWTSNDQADSAVKKFTLDWENAYQRKGIRQLTHFCHTLRFIIQT